MNKIVGRKEEQHELNAALQSKRAEFIVVYGRRRVGKTFLVQQFFRNKDCLYFNVTGVQDGLLKEQLKEFSKAIGDTFYAGASMAPSTSWLNAFEELTKAINNQANSKPIIIFIDELPWLATKRSRALQALDYYWNHYWSNNPKIKLIICGSSASWMIKNIIHHKGGLHNRNTRELLIKPFTLYETKEFLKSKKIKFNDKQILHLYMVLGGIPHYLEKVKSGLSAFQNIDQLCFNDRGVLFSEFDKLFKSLFDDAKTYIELIKIIAKCREGVSRGYLEDHSKFSSKGGTLTERLNDLELAGFIKSFLPLKHQRKGMYYRIIDEYVYFYLKWITPLKHTFLENNEYWISKSKTAAYHVWRGYAFESVCYKHITQIKKALKIPPGSHIGTWRYMPKTKERTLGAQIDLLFERSDDVVTMCEIKCTDEPFEIDKPCRMNLINKIEVYEKITRCTQQIFMAFISASGIKKTLYAEELVTAVVTLSDLFKD